MKNPMKCGILISSLFSMNCLASTDSQEAMQVIQTYFNTFRSDIRPFVAKKKWKELTGTECTFNKGYAAYKPITCTLSKTLSPAIAQIELTMEENARVLDMLVVKMNPGVLKDIKLATILSVLPGKRGKHRKEIGKNATSYSVATNLGEYGVTFHHKTGLESVLLTSGNTASLREAELKFTCPDKTANYGHNVKAALELRIDKNETVKRWCRPGERLLTFKGKLEATAQTKNRDFWYEKTLRSLHAYLKKQPDHHAWREMVEILEEEMTTPVPNLPTWDSNQNTYQLSGFRFGSFGIRPEVLDGGALNSRSRG